jgi:hypothetical protein
MAYALSGKYYVACSCKVGCPCIFGEPEGHDGYCDAQMTVDIGSGEISGVDVSGVKTVFAVNWPKGMVTGDGAGRMYFDPSSSAEQREALGRVFSGQEGGDLEGLGALIPTWIEPSEASIEVDTSNGKTTVKVGEVGEAVVEPMHNEAGDLTTVRGLPVEFAAETVLARGDGTRWTDPDMKEWESRGYAEQADFEWSS